MGESFMSAGKAVEESALEPADLQVFTLMLAICPVPLLLVSEDGVILMTNGECDQLFDYPPGGMIGAPVDMLVPENLRVSHAHRRNGFLKAPTRRPMGGGFDLFGVTRTGQTRRLELGLAPVTAGGRSGILVTAVDVSARLAVEAELERRSVELEGLNADLKHIARSASHGLKSPLTSICGLLSLAVDDIDEGNSEEARRILEAALKIGRRGTRLIEAVNDMTRGPSSSVESFSLRDVVRDLWLEVTATIPHPPRLVIDVAAGEPITADRKTLTMMLGHLLSNACRFADPAKKRAEVTVSACRAAPGLRLSVADNGVGVSGDVQHRVFYPFDRLHSNSGDGIGLTLVRRAAERLGGSVTFSSKPGVGSVFTLSIPQSESVLT